MFLAGADEKPGRRAEASRRLALNLPLSLRRTDVCSADLERDRTVLSRGEAGAVYELLGAQRPGLAVDRLELGCLDARDPMILESPRLWQHLPLERADRLVVRPDGAVEG